MTGSSNKTIAKNTIMLYLRMMVNMAISLYTSRVVLQTLGIVDFGVYGVVGGVVSMFMFFNNSMAGATSRFLTYELGYGDLNKLKDFFAERNNRCMVSGKQISHSSWEFRCCQMGITVLHTSYDDKCNAGAVQRIYHISRAYGLFCLCGNTQLCTSPAYSLFIGDRRF